MTACEDDKIPFGLTPRDHEVAHQGGWIVIVNVREREENDARHSRWRSVSWQSMCRVLKSNRLRFGGTVDSETAAGVAVE